MDGFADLLEDVRNEGGELMWVTKKKDFLENNFNKKRTPNEIKDQVLKSQTIQHAVDQIIEKNRKNENDQSKFLIREEIMKEAQDILNEMAHQFDLKYVRTLGYVLIKVFSKIYNHIYYNSNIVTNLEVLKHSPCLLLPLHRSYMDFLLVSIICFHKNIQMPAIATGMDFMGLSFLSKFIRHAGAFFIRRSFGSDQLYWAVFNEYVQAHLLNCDRPLEFFIEGTRSRTSKSLPPKHGMLATCLELYLKEHRVYDVYLVPISLTYERLLEEVLYSSELLGIPKPKESVSGLVKARSILNDCYGSIFINFGKPLSFREMIFHLKGSSGLYSSLTPNFVFELKPSQIKTIQSVSYTVLLEMLKNQVIQPISLIATCLLMSVGSQRTNYDNLKPYEWTRTVNLEDLSIQIENLKRIMINLGCKIYWPKDDTSNDATKKLILDNIQTHSNLFVIYNEVSKSNDFKNNLKLAYSTYQTNKLWISLIKPGSFSDNIDIFENAKNFLAMCSYRNQLVCFLIRKSFLCNCLLTMSANNNENFLMLSNDTNTDVDSAFQSYKFLSVLFNREFIFKEGDERKDFDESMNFLVHTNILKKQENGSFELIKLNLINFAMFARVFLPTMQNYNQIYTILISANQSYYSSEKTLANFIQNNVFEIIKTPDQMNANSLFDLEILSLNLISNALLALRQFRIIERVFNSVTKTYELKINIIALKEVNLKLQSIIIKNRHRLKQIMNSLGEASQEYEFNIENDKMSKSKL